MKILQNFVMKILLFTIINLFGLTLCAQDRCASTLNITKLRQKNPDAYQRFIELEKFTDEYRKKLSDPSNRLINQNAVITIPVVVHIVHNGVGLGVGRNIPDVQVFNQITILNQDFRRLNPDRNLTPAAFNGIVGDPIVEFRLACRDPNGNVTNGINRVTSTTNTFNVSGVDIL